jgi:squalene-hopene/tetraprenyl-beta-curcumene cyclase
MLRCRLFELKNEGESMPSSCRTLLVYGLCSAWVGGVVVVAQSGQQPTAQSPVAQSSATQSPAAQSSAAQPPAAQASPGRPQGRPLDPRLLNLTSSGPNRSDEPFAKTVSLEKTRTFLDELAVTWTRDRKCGTCHSNIPYMIGRAALGPHTPAADEVRNFFVDRANRWDSMGNLLVFFVDRANRWDSMGNLLVRGDVSTNKGWGLVTWFPHEVIVTGLMLAMDDAGTTGHLSPIGRQVLDRMWTLQRQDGGFYWLMATSHPYETSEYLGNAMAAVGAAMAPDDYAKTPAAQTGLKKLSKYLRDKNNSAIFLHDRIFVLWASTRVPDLITGEERDDIVRQLLALQHPDGGWSLPSLGNWRREDGTLNDREGAPSDGYGTGLVTYVLLQTGRSASDPVIERALNWLKTNQRESGRWFTRSINKDTYHFVTHIGTVYSAMALRSVGTRIDTDQ